MKDILENFNTSTLAQVEFFKCKKLTNIKKNFPPKQSSGCNRVT